MVRGGLGEDEIKKNWQVLETGGWGAQQRLGMLVQELRARLRKGLGETSHVCL